MKDTFWHVSHTLEQKLFIAWLDWDEFAEIVELQSTRTVRDRAPGPLFYKMLGQTHVNGWSRVISSQNRGSTDYIFLLRLGVLQWSRHLFNYWKKQENHN